MFRPLWRIAELPRAGLPSRRARDAGVVEKEDVWTLAKAGIRKAGGRLETRVDDGTSV